MKKYSEMMAFGGSQRKEFMKCFGWYKRIPHNRNNIEDGMKLEPRILKERIRIQEELVLGSSKSEKTMRYTSMNSIGTP